MSDNKQGFEFEHALAELESLVQKMESGDMTLEQSLKAFEQGVNLTRNCQKALSDAEQKVQLLLEKNGVLHSEPFQSGGDD